MSTEKRKHRKTGNPKGRPVGIPMSEETKRKISEGVRRSKDRKVELEF